MSRTVAVDVIFTETTDGWTAKAAGIDIAHPTLEGAAGRAATLILEADERERAARREWAAKLEAMPKVALYQGLNPVGHWPVLKVTKTQIVLADQYEPGGEAGRFKDGRWGDYWEIGRAGSRHIKAADAAAVRAALGVA